MLQGLGEWNTWWLVGENQPHDADSVDSYAQDLTSSAESEEAIAGRLDSACWTSGTFSIDINHYIAGSVFTVENEIPYRNTLNELEQPAVNDYRYERRRSSLRNPPRYRRSVLSRPEKQRRVGITGMPSLPLVTGSPNPGCKDISSDSSYSEKEKTTSKSVDFYKLTPDNESSKPVKAREKYNDSNGAEEQTDDTAIRDSGVYLTFDNDVCIREYQTGELWTHQNLFNLFLDISLFLECSALPYSRVGYAVRNRFARAPKLKRDCESCQ